MGKEEGKLYLSLREGKGEDQGTERTEEGGRKVKETGRMCGEREERSKVKEVGRTGLEEKTKKIHRHIQINKKMTRPRQKQMHKHTHRHADRQRVKV